MLEKYFSAPKTLRRFRSGISGPHIDAFADDLERDGYARPAPFDTFVPPPISAASFIGKAVVWQTSISTRWIRLVVIFAVADALISSEERLATTRVLE
jgi:hypothetical protein